MFEEACVEGSVSSRDRRGEDDALASHPNRAARHPPSKDERSPSSATASSRPPPTVPPSSPPSLSPPLPHSSTVPPFAKNANVVIHSSSRFPIDAEQISNATCKSLKSSFMRRTMEARRRMPKYSSSLSLCVPGSEATTCALVLLKLYLPLKRATTSSGQPRARAWRQRWVSKFNLTCRSPSTSGKKSST